MKKTIYLLMMLLLLAGCSSLKVTVDYDTEFDFTSAKRFTVVHHNKEGEDTLLNDRLIKALETDLQAKAYIKSDKSSADLIFVFHTNVESKTDIDTDYTMVGYGRYGFSGGMIATTRTYKYDKGTLIIDALNPADKKIVWRGTATDILKTYKTPQERIEYINGVVTKTMQDFPSGLEK